MNYSNTGNDSIEIDFYESFGQGIPCIMTSQHDSITSYLLAIPGNYIADLFKQYDNRLLESNVRTYLQARTNTNKGILKTIKESPHLFFAYNNGITATAKSAELHQHGNVLELIEVSDLQIVNGGQTTASLLYAREQNKDSLNNILVQMKLSVLNDDETQKEIVPNISRFSNTQNKVSDADLVANEVFQSEIERLVKSLKTPKLDNLVVPNWFYERSRGQYKSLFMYKSKGEKDKLVAQYPSKMNISKTDLAKCYMSAEGRPYSVSKGAQFCFLEFSKLIKNEFEKDTSYLNELWIKDAIAKVILFTELDSKIGKSHWYINDRGYKAQIVTYTIALFFEYFRRNGKYLNTISIWDSQCTPPNLLELMTIYAEAVGNVIKRPPQDVRNIAEFAKRAYCWDSYVSKILDKEHLFDDSVLKYAIPKSEWNIMIKQAKSDENTQNDMDLWTSYLGRVVDLKDIVSYLKRTDSYTMRIDKAFSGLTRARYRDGDGVVLQKVFKEYDDS